MHQEIEQKKTVRKILPVTENKRTNQNKQNPEHQVNDRALID
jgi:hypothetical protein